jgi:glycosyltransferase involved in cell wall biosynthesis
MEHLPTTVSGISGLPETVSVYSLGKERGKNRWREFWLFQKYLVQLVPQVDGVWAHQNPEYSILAAFWTHVFHKRLISWYAHGSVNWKVRLMTALTDVVATSSAQGFLLPTKKLKILQQGIDTELFAFRPKHQEGVITLMSVGRITPSKNLGWSIDVVHDLRQSGQPARLIIIGESARKGDTEYLATLQQQISRLQLQSDVEIRRAVPNAELPLSLSQADILINCSQTGSLDKVVLEAMATGTLVVTSNVAYREMFGGLSVNLFADSYVAVLDRVQALIRLTPEERQTMQQQLRAEVVAHHNLDTLVRRITELY